MKAVPDSLLTQSLLFFSDAWKHKMTPHLPSYLGYPLPKGPKGEGCGFDSCGLGKECSSR
jgi:hypothetical protein